MYKKKNLLQQVPWDLLVQSLAAGWVLFLLPSIFLCLTEYDIRYTTDFSQWHCERLSEQSLSYSKCEQLTFQTNTCKESHCCRKLYRSHCLVKEKQSIWKCWFLVKPEGDVITTEQHQQSDCSNLLNVNWNYAQNWQAASFKVLCK